MHFKMFLETEFTDSLMVLGRQFHSLGPVMPNDLSANVSLLVKGTQRRVLSHVDCRPGLEVVGLSFSNSDIYDGA